MKKNSDYSATVEQVEKMLLKIENPDTPVPEVEKLIAQARAKLQEARDWWRAEKDKL